MTDYAEVYREWEGETVAVLASGPSMTREVADFVRLSGVKTIAVNNQAIDTNGFKAMAPWATMLYAADPKWWHENRNEIAAFKGIKATIQMNNGNMPNTISDDVLVYRNGGPRGYDERPGYIRGGSNSGYQAVAVAVMLGAKRIVLCGFDMHNKNGEHWFGHHLWRKGYQSRYDIFIRSFTEVAPMYKKLGVEIVNTTPGSALKCFPFGELQETLYAMRAMRASETIRSTARAAEIGRDRAEARSSAGAATEGAGR